MSLALRRALVGAAGVGIVVVPALVGRAEAQIIPTSNPRAFVFQVSAVSFEELMSIPQVQALARSGSKALTTSADFPGAIPDHLVVNRDLVTSRPALMRPWTDRDIGPPVPITLFTILRP